MTLLLVVLLCACPFVAGKGRPHPSDVNFTFVRLPESSGAIALDGGLCAIETIKNSPKKLHIYLDGGEWCQDWDSCLYYSNNTSDSFLSMFIEGLVDPDQSKNPTLYDFSFAGFLYCDGASYSGNAVLVNGSTTLYSLGKTILDAQLEMIFATLGFGETVEEVVVTGLSSGGVAVLYHIDYMAEWVKTRFNREVRWAGWVNGGWFVEDLSDSIIPGNLNWNLSGVMLDLNNATGGMDTDCIAHYRPLGEAYKCAISKYLFPFITTPIFFEQSLLDLEQMSENSIFLPPAYSCLNVVNGDCNATDDANVNAYGDKYLASMQEVIGSETAGWWLTRCITHTPDFDPDGRSAFFPNLTTNGLTPYESFSAWYINGPTDPNGRANDQASWPNNPSCGAACSGAGAYPGRPCVHTDPA